MALHVEAGFFSYPCVNILPVSQRGVKHLPAAGLINYYRGNKLVLINLSPTPYDSYANLVIHEKIGEVFASL